MQQNVGVIDRGIRIAIGVVVLAWGMVNGNWWGMIGLIPLYTGLAGYCWLYSLLEILKNRK